MIIQHNNFCIHTLSILKQNKSRITLSCVSTAPRADLPCKSKRMVTPFNLRPQPITSQQLTYYYLVRHSLSIPLILLPLLQTLTSALWIILIVYFSINKQYWLQELQQVFSYFFIYRCDGRVAYHMLHIIFILTTPIF